ncbi:VTT domain-containing protein [Microbacterium sp. M3]|uniref:VTT domain-containing protein n=1 Tax=Microbacterium arthrosphaerae TaxID=792652 RepID=A0ABU4GZ97_9MICO|nr:MULTISPECIES: VTT domain-containing protein [Microbacterium]MDW4572383.1 VTT domain-containing protein [Microbacterium arthrosphaerae]MDW7606238.1 VTT domain-containing protein [Microbacterium sp. M3]
MELLTDVLMQAIASPWLYLVMLAVAIVDGFFPPVPSETVLVAAAAVAASTGEPNLAVLGAAAAVGAAVGDNIAFALGRRTGTDRFAWMRRPRVAGAFDWAGGALERRGAGLVMGARFVPVGRVAVNLSAGALGYPWRRFAGLSVAAGICWAVYSIAIGVLAGAWLKDQPLLSAGLGIVLALSIGLVIDRVVALRARRASASPDSPSPDRMTSCTTPPRPRPL